MDPKRGQAAVQFNWIFALIAGGIILAFFVMIVLNQRESSEQQSASVLATRMDALVAGAKVSTGRATVVNIRDIDLIFDCENYRIGNLGAVDIGGKIIFTPDRIRGDGLLLWSQSWKAPYEVTNFVYITNPEVKYIMIGNSQAMRNLNTSLPKEMNKQRVLGISQARYTGEEKVRIITEGATPTIPSDFSGAKEITLVKVLPDQQSGVVEFHTYDGNSFVHSGESVFIGRASMYGAIFAQNKELYDCNMQDAFENLNLVTKMYWLRTAELAKATNLSSNCLQIYQTTNATTFRSIESISRQYESTQTQESALMAEIGLLEDNYNRKLQGFSCPVIY